MNYFASRASKEGSREILKFLKDNEDLFLADFNDLEWEYKLNKWKHIALSLDIATLDRKCYLVESFPLFTVKEES